MAAFRQNASATALIGLVAALAHASAASAQDVGPDPSARAVSAPPPPQAAKPSYRGSYPAVGAPVRPAKPTKSRRLRQSAPLAPVVPAAIVVAPPAPILAAPGLPPLEPPRKNRRKVEADPYEPLGFDTGGLVFRPSIEASGGYDTNPNRIPGARKGSAAFRQEGGLRIDSEWERHAFRADLRGAYMEYPAVRSANRPEGQGEANLRLDVLRDTQLDLGAAYAIATERPGSIEQPLATSKRSTILNTGVNATLTQRFGPALVSLRGAVDRTAYGAVTQPDGVEVSQDNRDLNAYSLRLRGGYELTPGVIPFVEALVDRRVYDATINVGGYERSSSGVQGRVGSTFEITRTLTGEASAGYGTRDYEDPRLSGLRGPVADAALIWSATPLTTVTLRGASSLAETTVVGAAGAQVRTVAVDVSHALLRNLIISATGAFYQNDYVGQPLRESGYTAGLKLEYKLTRSVAMKASFTHERLNAATPGSDYTANVFLVGLRLQP
ncbi:outer membrane beta-barrel protein [Alsobacter metallidurans]|uniref:outer membrane beta-barrel protein n=1 Tax=Alsobacter metallidurans TaxID=340221 RepID=UPI001664D430|nr:outer membrane beta-barrel protein [Alsobacter metallidurans]